MNLIEQAKEEPALLHLYDAEWIATALLAAEATADAAEVAEAMAEYDYEHGFVSIPMGSWSDLKKALAAYRKTTEAGQ